MDVANYNIFWINRKTKRLENFVEDGIMLKQKKSVQEFNKFTVEYTLNKEIYDLLFVKKDVNIYNVISILRWNSLVWFFNKIKNKKVLSKKIMNGTLSFQVRKKLLPHMFDILDKSLSYLNDSISSYHLFKKTLKIWSEKQI